MTVLPLLLGFPFRYWGDFNHLCDMAMESSAGSLRAFPIKRLPLRSVPTPLALILAGSREGRRVGQLLGGAEGRRAPMGGNATSFDPNFMGTIDFRGVTRGRKWELCEGWVTLLGDGIAYPAPKGRTGCWDQCKGHRGGADDTQGGPLLQRGC